VCSRYRSALARRGGLRGQSNPSLENAAGHPPGGRIGQKNRGRKKEHGTSPGNLGQQIARAACTEDGRTGAAENRSYIRPLALLQQNNNHHRDTNNNMESDNCCNHRLF